MRTLKYVLVSILGLAMLMSAQPASVKSYSDPDAREVYRALIAPQAKRSPLLLSTTVKPWICLVSPKEIADPEFRESMEVFHDVNQEVWDLSSVLSDRKTISQAQLDETFKPGVIEGWKLFREKYPDFVGYVALSAVGFNKLTPSPWCTRRDDAAASAVRADSNTSAARLEDGREPRRTFRVATGSREPALTKELLEMHRD